MKTMTTMVAAATLALGAAGSALADPVYPHVGSVNPTSYTFEAVASGEIDAYFLSSSAADTDVLYMSVNGVPTGVTGFNNHTATRGQKIDLGSVTKGEIITFYIDNVTTGLTYSSNTAQNADGTSHIYSTSFAGAKPIPAGTFIAFEDLATKVSDHDYNDIAFSVTNIAAVPEPANLALMLAGLGLVGAAARRRRAR